MMGRTMTRQLFLCLCWWSTIRCRCATLSLSNKHFVALRCRKNVMSPNPGPLLVTQLSILICSYELCVENKVWTCNVTHHGACQIKEESGSVEVLWQSQSRRRWDMPKIRFLWTITLRWFANGMITNIWQRWFTWFCFEKLRSSARGFAEERKEGWLASFQWSRCAAHSCQIEFLSQKRGLHGNLSFSLKLPLL